MDHDADDVDYVDDDDEMSLTKTVVSAPESNVHS